MVIECPVDWLYLHFQLLQPGPTSNDRDQQQTRKQSLHDVTPAVGKYGYRLQRTISPFGNTSYNSTIAALDTSAHESWPWID